MFPEQNQTKTGKGRKSKNQHKEKLLKNEIILRQKQGQFLDMKEEKLIKAIQNLAKQYGIKSSRIWVKAFCRRNKLKFWTISKVNCEFSEDSEKESLPI